MRKIKEILRLRFVCGIGQREIARSCQIARSTVRDYLRRAQLTGLTWDSAAGLNEAEVEARLYPDRRPPAATRPLPDCEYIYNQLRSHRKMNLTLTQLWLEYRERHHDGYQYTQFCEYYKPVAGQAGLRHAPPVLTAARWKPSRLSTKASVSAAGCASRHARRRQ